MPTLTCVEDLRQKSLRRVPRMFVDYAESGSYQEETLRANRHRGADGRAYANPT